MIKLKIISVKAFISLLIIVALVFELSQGAEELAPGQHVTGQITLGQQNDNKNNIEISEPNALSGWKLEPGTINEQKGTLHVKAKGSWQIKVSADEATKGYLTEYMLTPADGKDENHKEDGKNGAYVKDGKRLKNSMKVKAEGYNEVDLKDGGVLLDYRDTSQGNNWQTLDIPITFEQEVSWDDMPLPEGHIYHLAIDFNPS